jgi:hypothetical protein
MDTQDARSLVDRITRLADRVDNLRHDLGKADRAAKASKDGRSEFRSTNFGLEVRINLGFVRAQLETDLKDAERVLAALIGRLESRD